MNKMRDSAKWFFYILIGAFIITIIFEWGMNYNGSGSLGGKRGNIAGTVNGASITNAEYERMYKNYVEGYRQQMKGAEIDEQTDAQIREQIWNELVQQRLFNEQYEKLGLKVTDKEIVDAIHSENPPQIIAQQFRDPSTGRIDRNKLQAAIAAPENKKAWIQVEEMIREQKLREKLQSLVTESVTSSDGDARQKFEQNTLKLQAKFVLFDFSKTKNDTLYEVSEGEIKSYFREHKDADYKQEPVRTAKFALFNNTPTSTDSAAIKSDLTKLVSEFSKSTNDTEFVSVNGDLPPNFDKSFARGGLNEEIEKALYDGEIKVGKVAGPVQEFSEYKLIKIEKIDTGEVMVRASHILLHPTGNTKADTAKAVEEAKKLIAEIRSGKVKFEEAAKEKSKDPGSGARGGDLGWFGKNRMVKPFEEAAFKGKVGELVGPVQTQFGVHIIKVIAKDNRVIKGVELTRKIVASPSTIEKQRNKANEFQYGATEIGFEKQADSSKITLRESGQFQKNGFIPFLGVNRTISGFAFRAKLNEISPVLETKDGFVVMKLTDMNDEGYRKLDDNLKKDIKSKLVRQKKLDDLRKLANDAISKAEGKIESVAKADSQLVVRSTGVLGYNTPNVPGLGSDKNFVAALSGLEKDKLSQPIETNRGIAVAVLTEKNVGSDADFEVQKDNLRKQILQEKKTQVQQNWLQALKKQAKIEDDRNAGF